MANKPIRVNVSIDETTAKLMQEYHYVNWSRVFRDAVIQIAEKAKALEQASAERSKS